MRLELFQFQRKAVDSLRDRVAMALSNYANTQVPQVVSLQAPTGAGKTIVMVSLIEEIFFGSDSYQDQPNAIFVWLSDSPSLNEQSKQKVETKSDKIRLDKCITIEDESFDQEVLEDGHIYFLNTQKLSKSSNLSHLSDKRSFTIWQTIENTLRTKSDRLYFIIDEAHRGMQGLDAGRATSIMQRFLKGFPALNLSPLPIVIGMSATAERFNKLVSGSSSTLNIVNISSEDVRTSGLLKDRIVITYPADKEKENEFSILQAATDEWLDKCDHWRQYCSEQHYAQVNPIFVIQVKAGNDDRISETSIEEVISVVEKRMDSKFQSNEVVHTFGSKVDLEINGLTIPYVEPADIAEDKRIKVVLFKENLSTGWDCPRAETMMSFRKAEDSTYIAQLLGRMVRTPMQSHILVDETLNEVRLFLPYFDKSTVKKVVDDLQSTEGGDIPTVIDDETTNGGNYVRWTVNTKNSLTKSVENPNQENFLGILDKSAENQSSEKETTTATSNENTTQLTETKITSQTVGGGVSINRTTEPAPASISAPPDKTHKNPIVEQLEFQYEINRQEIIKFINGSGLLSFVVRETRVAKSYLQSLLSLASLLTRSALFPTAKDKVDSDIVQMIRDNAEELRSSGKYNQLSRNITEIKFNTHFFDVFGKEIKQTNTSSLFSASEDDIDRQLRAVDSCLGSSGITYSYGRKYNDEQNPNKFKIDCILFVSDQSCMEQLSIYAEKKFHELEDKYRKYIVKKDEQFREEYKRISRDSDTVSKSFLTLPETITVKKDADGTIYHNHLYADENGEASIKLNGWEEEVISEESQSSDFVCWLRNVPRARWALCVPYEKNKEIKSMYPDFLIIRKDPELKYVVDILEPHSPDFADNLAKAQGLADYAEKEPQIGKVQLIRKVKRAGGHSGLQRLDMSVGEIREKVKKAFTNDELDHLFEEYGVFNF